MRIKVRSHAQKYFAKLKRTKSNPFASLLQMSEVQEEKTGTDIANFGPKELVRLEEVIPRRSQMYTTSILKLLNQRGNLFRTVTSSGGSVLTDSRCSKHDENIATLMQYILDDSSIQQSKKREIASWVRKAVQDSPSSYQMGALLQEVFSETGSIISNSSVEEMESTVVNVGVKRINEM